MKFHFQPERLSFHQENHVLVSSKGWKMTFRRVNNLKLGPPPHINYKLIEWTVCEIFLHYLSPQLCQIIICSVFFPVLLVSYCYNLFVVTLLLARCVHSIPTSIILELPPAAMKSYIMLCKWHSLDPWWFMNVSQIPILVYLTYIQDICFSGTDFNQIIKEVYSLDHIMYTIL